MPGIPMTNQVKVSLMEDGRKQERVFGFVQDATCRSAVEQVCTTLSIPEDWTFAMYSRKHGGWIHDDTRISDITFKGAKSLELRRKTPLYFEAIPRTPVEPSKSSLRDSSILRGPSSPIDHHRLFSFFRTTDDQFVSKFENGSIYLSVIILNSDKKILLSPSGIPPTVLISTIGGLASYYNFDSDSSDFAWMFKTTLDWASDPPTKRIRNPRSAAASPEPRPISPFAESSAISTLSPPSSRGSFPRSKRGSVSSTTGPTNNGTITNGTSSNGSKLTVSSVSMDRSSACPNRQSLVYEYLDRKVDYRAENSLRQEYVAAVEELQSKLGSPPIDLLYDKVIDMPLVGAKSVIAVQYVRDDIKEHIAPELIQMGSFRWRHIDSVSNSVYTRKEEIWSNLTNYYDNVRVSKPSSGLYVGLYYTESTMSGLQILVPRKRRTCIPLVKLRDKTELSSEEWKWVCSTASLDSDQLAKNCAVSKDDPMHHLKVEFAHSTATLSRLTQLKWNPSDLYTLDTMQVMMQSASSPQPTIQLDSQQLFSMSPELSKLDLTPSHQGMVAMDQDPVWKMEHIDVATAKAFRVILFVKPTRHATQPQEQFNRQLFELCPFPIFDALHHSVFNTETYHQLRRSMLHLTNEIMDLEFELDQEMEQELAQQKERERAEAESYSDDDEDDMDESSLIEDLGIKGDSPPRVKYHHPRHRSSFIGDEAIHGTGRPSLNSLLEALQQSVAMTSSAVSLASSLSSTGNETPDIVPQDYSAGSNRPRSRTSAMENEMGRGIISPQRRRGSKASQDKSLIDETIRETLSAFMNTARDQGTTKTETIMSANRNNASSLSLESTSSISSASSDESNSNSNRGREVHYEELTRRPFSACTGRMENRSLSQVVSLPRHRRSYSLVQAADVRMAALPGFGSKSSSRPRTNSYSSYTYHSTQHSYYHHYQHQQPVYRNRYLSSKNYPHYLSQIQQHQQHLRHHPHQQQQQQNQHSDDDLLFPDNTDQMNQFPPELARLQKEQQELQEQWRMISWTRQLNEWDHARTLKAQGNLLGYGMGINMGMSMSSGMAVNMSMSINPLDVDDSAEVESSPEL